MLGTAPSIPLLESLPLSPDETRGITGTLGGRSFLDYGTVYSGAEGERANPQPTFWAPIGTKVLAPVTGTVVAIPVLWSGDFSVMISAAGSNAWRWEAEHVIDVSVVVGDHVTAGQSIAIVSDYDERNTPGIGLVELGLLEGGNPPRHHCPFLYIAPALEVEILNQVRGMLEENAARLSLPVVDIAAPAVPGCVTTEPIEG